MNETIIRDARQLVGQTFASDMNDTAAHIASVLGDDVQREALAVVMLDGIPLDDTWQCTDIAFVDADQSYGAVVSSIVSAALDARDANGGKWFIVVRGGAFDAPQGWVPETPVEVDVQLHNDVLDAMLARAGYRPLAELDEDTAPTAEDLPIFADLLVHDLVGDAWYSTKQLAFDPLAQLVGPYPLDIS